MARLDPASIAKDARQAARAGHGSEAMFLSSAMLRALDIIAPLKAERALPTLAPNRALARLVVRLAAGPRR